MDFQNFGVKVVPVTGSGFQIYLVAMHRAAHASINHPSSGFPDCELLCCHEFIDIFELLVSRSQINVSCLPAVFRALPRVGSAEGLIDDAIAQMVLKDSSSCVVRKHQGVLRVRIADLETAAFTVASPSLTIPPGASVTDTIRFTPSTLGTVSGHVVIVSNAISSPDSGAVSESYTLFVIASAVGFSPTAVRPDSGYIIIGSHAPISPDSFNPSTTIRFGLPARSRVTIDVFNMLGQMVTRLIEEELAAGYVERQWSTSVPSGVYIHRMRAEAVGEPGRVFVQVSRMTLVR